MNIMDLFKNTKSASEGAYNYYKTLCTMKKVEVKPLSAFTQETISAEIDRLKQIKVTYPASDNQIIVIKNLLEQLKMVVPETFGELTSEQARNMIDVLRKKVPATDNQMRRLKDYIRFGIISNVEDNISQFDASTLISAHQDDYKLLSEGKATLYQVEKIVKLRSQLGETVTDIAELNAMSYESAQLLLEQLQAEYQNRWELLKSPTKYDEGRSTARSIDAEKEGNMSCSELDFEQKKLIFVRLCQAIGQPIDTDSLGEDTIENDIKDLMVLARMYISEKELFGIVSSVVEEKSTNSKKKSA